VNPKFLEGVEEFKAMIKEKLAPKKSINEKEFITGEGTMPLIATFSPLDLLVCLPPNVVIIKDQSIKVSYSKKYIYLF
jgi:hypothetical protein